jgi:hypothetical protein
MKKTFLFFHKINLFYSNKIYFHPFHVQDSDGFSLKDENDEEMVNDL